MLLVPQVVFLPGSDQFILEQIGYHWHQAIAHSQFIALLNTGQAIPRLSLKQLLVQFSSTLFMNTAV